MDDYLRFNCLNCGKRLKAKPTQAGRRGRCACGQEFLVPGELPEPLPEEPQDDLPFEQPARRAAKPTAAAAPRRSRGMLWKVIAGLAAVLLLGGGGYWWINRPPSELEAIYQNYIRTGNELADIHQVPTNAAEAEAAKSKLLDKAKENLDAWEKKEAVKSRWRGKLDDKYQEEINKTQARLFELVKDFMADRIPILVIWGKKDNTGNIGFFHSTMAGSYSVFGLGPRPTPVKGTKTEPPYAAPPSDTLTAAQADVADFEGSWAGVMPRAITSKPDDFNLTVTFNKKGEGSPRFIGPDGGMTIFTGSVTANLRAKENDIRVVLLREWKVALSADKKTMTWIEAKEGKTKIVFQKKATPIPVVRPDDSSARLAALAGDWETPAMSLKINKTGRGTYTWLFGGGNSFAEVVGELRVQIIDDKTTIAMSPVVFGEKQDYIFAAKLSADGATLDLEDTKGKAKSRTLTRKGAAIPAPAAKSKPDPDVQGTWKLITLYTKLDGGTKSYIAITSKEIMTIQGNSMTVEMEKDGKAIVTKYSLNFDPGKNQKVYTQTPVDGEKKVGMSGIYTIRDGKLWFCSQADGKAPESFTVNPDDGKDRVILEYERVAAKK